MKNFFKVLSLALVAAFVLASCQKEENLSPEPEMPESKVILQRSIDFSKNSIEKKGAFHQEDESLLQYIKVSVLGSEEEYYAVKIKVGKGVFKVFMIDNLRNKPSNVSGIYHYADFSLNKTNGTLYQWEAANTIASSATASLVPSGVVLHNGRLPNMSDINHLFENLDPVPDYEQGEDYLDSASPEDLNVDGVFTQGYLDLFVLGGHAYSHLDWESFGGTYMEDQVAKKTLWGQRDSQYNPYGDWYQGRGSKGEFWTSEYATTSGGLDFYYSMFVSKDHPTDPTRKYITGVNSAKNSLLGYSVRLVFDLYE